MKQSLVFVVSIATGIIFWIIACKFTGLPEAWDSADYYIIGLPFFMFINMILGLIEPRQSWRWGALSTMSQFIPMILVGESSPYWPIGFVTFAFFSTPVALAAMFGAKLNKVYFGSEKNGSLHKQE